MDKRPLSPHLQVYRWSILMASSILHRMSGVALYAAFFLFVGFLLSLALGPWAYDHFACFGASLPGSLMLFAVLWALFHHMLGGVRHLVWDLGRNLEPVAARRTALIFGILGLVLALSATALFVGVAS